MKKLATIAISLVMMFASTSGAYADTSDKDLAKQWRDKHCPKAHIEKVVTVSKGGYKGKVKGTKWTVKYPKKVKKGKTVKVYMVVKNNDVKAMVCLGKVK